jgi:hypothetical protein
VLDSAVRTVPITITPVNDAPNVGNDSPQPARQYSDPISPVTVTASDKDSDVGSLSASVYGWKADGAASFNTTTKPLSDPSVSGSGLDLSAPTTAGSSRKWTLEGRALVAAGKYIVRVRVEDGDHALASTDVAITVSKEDAYIEYSGETFKNTASANTNSATVNLAGVIREAGATGAPGSDSTLGTKLPATQLKFTVEKFGGGVAATCTTNLTQGSNAGTANGGCAVTLAAGDPYMVKVEQLVNNYYEAAIESQAITVALPGTGFTTGGGWLNEPNIGSRSNFGYNVKRLKNGNIQGNSLYIYRRTANLYQMGLATAPNETRRYNWIIKSNSWAGGGLSLNTACNPNTLTSCSATFSGKSTVSAVDRDTGLAYALGGNYSYRVDVTDAKEPGSSPGAGPDTYGIRVWTEANGLYYQLYDPANPVSSSNAYPQLPIDGGNIQVRP